MSHTTDLLDEIAKFRKGESDVEWLLSLARAGVELANKGDGACDLLDENNRHDRQHTEFHEALAAFRAAEGSK